MSVQSALLPGFTGHLDKIFNRPTQFPSETGSLPMGEFVPGPEVKEVLAAAKVLCIGAGGLGCELLKNMALSGFRDIHVIDLDTVDVTNLNRQFLFRAKDVGKSKAETAAAFVQARVPGVKITPHVGKVQDQPDEFYKSFKLVFGGLDNLEARRWVNAKLCSFVEVDEEGNPTDPDQIIPFIDGGTEGFKGQVKVMLPRITSCFECGLDAFPPETTFAMCTVAERPRKPEHCIAYAMMVLWNRKFDRIITLAKGGGGAGGGEAEEGGNVDLEYLDSLPPPPAPTDKARKYDTDSPADMRWICDRAVERAAKFGITGVDYMMTLGVVKNIIPAVASTNAIVSALAVAEAVKLLTFASQSLNNYYQFMGSEGIISTTFTMEVKETCPVCRQQKFTMSIDRTALFREVVRKLVEDKHLKNVAVTGLYVPTGFMAAATAPNLDKTIEELGLVDGDELQIDDPTLPVGLTVVLNVRG